MERLCLRAPEPLEGAGATAAGCLRRPPVLPAGALRALGGVFAQGGLGGLTALVLEGAAEGAAVAALLDGMMRAGSGGAGGGAASLQRLEELCLPCHYIPGHHHDDAQPQQQQQVAAAADTAAPLLALAACVRAGRFPSLRRLRLPVAAVVDWEEDEEGVGVESEGSKLMQEAWGKLFRALAAAHGGAGPAPPLRLEEVVLAVGDKDDVGSATMAASMVGVVRILLPGVSVSWG